MQIIEKKQHLKTAGVLETKKYGIVFNPKMVKILSDGLYSDKILAIIRELSANAYDSHVAAGNKHKPFEIHLPTTLNPLFYIRDYGTGLSEEDVDKIYTIYGASDKEDTNDQIGCLGLGSKTPFCYNTKSATIETWYNGVHYIYTAHLGNDGMPALSKLSEAPSSEPSGVKISLPVHSYDVQNFKHTAQKVFSYFAVKPIIKGNVFTIQDIKYSFKKDTWGVREHGGPYNGAVAVMGNLAYPINFTDSNLNSDIKNALSSNIDLYFNIGDLDIEASREGLSYDSRTKGNIVNLVKKLLAELKDLINSQLDSTPSLWDARLYYNTVLNTFGQQMLRIVGVSNLEWKKQPLFTRNSYSNHYIVDLSHKITTYSKISYRKTISENNTDYIAVDNDIVLVKDDLKKGGINRVKYYIRQNTDKKVLFFSGVDPVKDADIIKDLGCLPSHIILTSSLPKPVRTVNTNPNAPRVKRGSSTSVLKFHQVDIFKTKCWTNFGADLKLGGIYVEVKNFDILNTKSGVFVHPRIIGTMDDCIKLFNINININDIYGIKSNLIPKLSKYPGKWTNLFDLVTTEIDKIKNSINIDAVLSAKDEMRVIGRYDSKLGCHTINYDALTKLKPLVDKTTTFYNFITEVDKFENLANSSEKALALQKICDQLKIAVPTATKPVQGQGNIEKMQSQIYHKYILLSDLSNAINYSNTPDYLKQVAKYINSVG